MTYHAICGKPPSNEPKVEHDPEAHVHTIGQDQAFRSQFHHSQERPCTTCKASGESTHPDRLLSNLLRIRRGGREGLSNSIECQKRNIVAIERKKIALTWHYRRAEPSWGKFQSEECDRRLQKSVARHYDVEVMRGKANLEVRPRFVNKGEIARRLIAAYGDGPSDPPEFVLCLGDDSTDEGNFSQLDCTDRLADPY